MIFCKNLESRGGVSCVIPALEPAIFDDGYQVQPLAILISIPDCDAVGAGLIENCPQHVFQQFVRVGLPGERVQRVSESIQLAARQVFRSPEGLGCLFAFRDVHHSADKFELARLPLGRAC